MTTLDVAHIREQGQDMIIVPLDRSFDHKTESQQQAAIYEIQSAANNAGLRGTVVAVWPASSGGMKFRGPQPWHPYLRGLSLQQILASVNKKLTW